MNKELKTKWVTALRSGEYIQEHKGFKGEDRNGNITHCCLAVLCDIQNTGDWFEGIDPHLSSKQQRSLIYYNDENDFDAVATWIEGNIAVGDKEIQA